MGDRTYMQIRIYDCPSTAVRDVIDALAEHGFDQGDYEAEDNQLVLGSQYIVEEATLGTLVYELSPALAELDVTFDGWEDPKYEFLGAGSRHSPAKGSFDYACDSDGSLVFNVDDISAMFDLDEQGRLDALGQNWFDEPTPEAGTLLTAPEEE